MAATWITAADVLPALGPAPTSPGDVAHLDNCVAAANDLAFDWRFAAGYVDDELVVPSARVYDGVISLAVLKYRARGAVDGFASYEESGGFVPTGASLTAIKEALGVRRGVFA